MEHKLKAWIVFAGGTKFGEGRAELFRLIDAEGSLKKAVERMGMSYRAAWGYVRELESAAGFAFLERAGTGPSGGARLTDEAKAFLASFETFRARVEAEADDAFRAEFGTASRTRRAARPSSGRTRSR